MGVRYGVFGPRARSIFVLDVSAGAPVDEGRELWLVSERARGVLDGLFDGRFTCDLAPLGGVAGRSFWMRAFALGGALRGNAGGLLLARARVWALSLVA